MGVAVHDHDWSQAARAQTAHRLQAEAAILARPTGLDAKTALHPVQHLTHPAHVTGRTRAHADIVTPLGCQGEKGIEGDDSINPGQGLIHAACDMFYEYERKISDDILTKPQNSDKRTGSVPMCDDNGVYLDKLCGGE